MDQIRARSFMTLFAMVLLVAFGLRAFIPVGYMPEAPKAKDVFRMVICLSDGAKTMTVGDEFNPFKDPAEQKSHKKDNDHNAPCGFSVDTAFAKAASHNLVATTLTVAVAELISFHTVLMPATIDGISLARGPPVYRV